MTLNTYADGDILLASQLNADNTDNIPLDIKPNFTPYQHQLVAFERLTRSKHSSTRFLISDSDFSEK